MFASTRSAVLVGVEPSEVSVEARVAGQREGYSIVGLPDTAVREARHRVRSAIAQSGHSISTTVTVNLGPADLPKSGSGFDFAMALAVLGAAKHIPGSSLNVVAVGELALDGRIRAGGSSLAGALVARDLGIPCLLPPDAAAEAACVPGADIWPVGSLRDAVRMLTGVMAPDPVEKLEPVDDWSLDLTDVRGQGVARRALEIAAAGGHHLLLVGAPGCGKTMLARRLPSILPGLTSDESLDVACVWSAASRRRPLSAQRPFRAPHHSASSAAVLGGGSGIPVPGEISLAHHGVLFLDELGEYPANLVDALRQPMEQGAITIARKGASVTYPSRCQIVAATNPCPCGFRGDTIRECTCTESAIAKYRSRMSGPLLDRFDLRVLVARPERLDGPPGEVSAVVRTRVLAAREIQAIRGGLNRDLDGPTLDNLEIEGSAHALVTGAVERGLITGRGYDRTRRVARTIADLADAPSVGSDHVAEAMALRGRFT